MEETCSSGSGGSFDAVGLLAGCGSDSSNDSGANKTYKVGVVQLVEHPALDAANKGFVDGLASKGLKIM